MRTRRHTLVYDAGPAFRSGSDTGALVVAPFLAYSGIQRLDLAIVSHADLDHSGGLSSIADALPVALTMTGERLTIREGANAIPCVAGQVWFWDSIRFRVLHPTIGGHSEGNDASCVVEIGAGETRALLTGDIESGVERELLSNGLLQPMALVVMPHHGSKTSSHATFVDSMAADVAVASTGHGNRWGMPVDAVVRRWRNAGADVLNTASDGAVGLQLCADTGLERRYRQRTDLRRFWNER